VGGGNSAGQAAVYLSSQVAKVWLVVRGPGLEASMSRYLVDRITARPNVEILTETTVTALEGQDGILEAIRCHSQRSSEEVKLAILARAAIPFAVLGQRRASSIRCRARMSEDRPLFAFAFHGGLGQALRGFAEADVAAGNADFVWVHLDLRDAGAQAWLRGRPWPPDVVETVAAPIQRGRLFIVPDLVYGHLRDFRDEPDAVTLQAGSLCVVASRTLLVTGRRIPLLSVKELRRRVEGWTVLPASPFGVIPEFFKALNDGCFTLPAAVASAAGACPRRRRR
jgi:Mg2+ and Co2+ transporter CorA